MKKPGRPNQDKLEKKYKIETILVTNYQTSNENDTEINVILFHTGISIFLSVLLIIFW